MPPRPTLTPLLPPTDPPSALLRGTCPHLARKPLLCDATAPRLWSTRLQTGQRLPHSAAPAAAPAASAGAPLGLGRCLLLDQVESLLVHLLHDEGRRLALLAELAALPVLPPVALSRDVPLAGATHAVAL